MGLLSLHLVFLIIANTHDLSDLFILIVDHLTLLPLLLTVLTFRLAFLLLNELLSFLPAHVLSLLESSDEFNAFGSIEFNTESAFFLPSNHDYYYKFRANLSPSPPSMTLKKRPRSIQAHHSHSRTIPLEQHHLR